MREITVKKMSVNSPEYRESNLQITLGTPQYCWEQFWEFAPVITSFSRGECDFFKPIQRNVVKKIYLTPRVNV